MDELIGNHQTHEFDKRQNFSKKDMKKNKSLALKVTPIDNSEQDEDMAYLTRRLKKVERKHGKFMKKGNSRKLANVIDLCNKCGKQGHFFKDYCHGLSLGPRYDMTNKKLKGN